LSTLRFDMEAVRADLATHAAEVAIAVLGEPNRSMSNRRELRFGRKGSLSVVIAGPDSGLYFDHENDTGGDLIHLIQRKRCGSFQDAVGYATKNVIGSTSVQPPPVRTIAPDRDNWNNQRRALALWDAAQPIVGTVAASYLEHQRGVLDVALSVGDAVLRFHPRCPFKGHGFLPALLALYRNIDTDAPCAVHRTALTPDGRKLPLLTAADGRMTLGPTRGTAIKLIPDEDVSTGLTIGEGLETVLSAMVKDLSPAWALGGTGGVANFPILPGVEVLTIVVDHDRNHAGQQAALKCSTRWGGAGREALRIIPRFQGNDFNDVIISERKVV
jgi:putative DNA primase/helicase